MATINVRSISSIHKYNEIVKSLEVSRTDIVVATETWLPFSILNRGGCRKVAQSAVAPKQGIVIFGGTNIIDI